MPEYMNFMTSMIEAQTKKDVSDAQVEMFKKMSKGQSVNSFGQFCNTVQSNEFLKKALESGDLTTIKALTGMYNEIGKAF